jgi:hypothetical protein
MKDRPKKVRIIKQKRLNLRNQYCFKYGVDLVVQNYFAVLIKNMRKPTKFIKRVQRLLK